MNIIKKIYNRSEEFVSKSVEYPKGSMYEFLEEAVNKYPYYTALEYYGKSITYKKFFEKVIEVAKSLKAIGVLPKDIVTICMPNTPEALVMFYAVNMVGAVASMIHPLAGESEIEFYISTTNSKIVLTINLFAEKVIKAAKDLDVQNIIVSDVSDSMFRFAKRALSLYDSLKSIIYPVDHPRIKYNNKVVKWKDFYNLGNSYKGKYKEKVSDKDEAVILYSGGTTGKPKGVVLSNLNLNALSVQCINEFSEAKVGDSILVVLPIFHGFGLGVSIHSILTHGLKCVLVPKFTPNSFARLIRRYKPVFLTGVPTMYEAMVNIDDDSNYLKSVKYCISGGDALKPELREKVNNYLLMHGSIAQIRVGYGLTESTAACILTPGGFYKENAIGYPFADTFVKIVKPGTIKEVRYNREGEICISGPTVMIGYYNEEKETNEVLKIHDDGKLWLHTGDLGYKDKEGIIYFKSRLKRLIVTSGYNVYPSYLEKIIESYPAVEKCVVVGINHSYKQQVPVACIVLKNNYQKSDELIDNIKAYCETNIAKYSLPYKYEFYKTLPKTLIGKINYRRLQDECSKKYSK